MAQLRLAAVLLAFVAAVFATSGCKRSRADAAELTAGTPAVTPEATKSPRAEWEAVADLPDCAPSRCTGPRMGMPNWTCPDGRTGGPVCKQAPDGTCSWRVVRCPEGDPPPMPPPMQTPATTATPVPRTSPPATPRPATGRILPSAADAVADACATPCAASQTRRGILRCVDDDRKIIGVAGAINCPSVSMPSDERRSKRTCAAYTAETECAGTTKCLAMDGTCCDRDGSLVIPTGSLENMYCGSPGQRCSRCKCLPGDAMIATPEGERPLQDLKAGDDVWTETPDGGRVAAPIVELVRIPAPPGHRVLEVVLEDGRTLRASPTHPAHDGTPLEAFVAGSWLDGSRVTSSQLVSPPIAATLDVLPAGGTGIYWVNGVRLRSTIPTSAIDFAR